MKKYYIGVDVGGTKIAAALVERAGQIVLQDKVPTLQNGKPEEIYQQIVSIIGSLLKEAKIKKEQLKGIGIGIPGVISADHRDIKAAPNINLTGFPLTVSLEKEYATAVALGNDVNLGLLGEMWLGAGGDTRNLIGIFPGTGVGGAIIVNGYLVTGAQGAAGELGHMIINQSSKKSSAGIKGTVEALASRRAIERDIRAAVRNGEKTVVTDLLDGSLAQIKSKVIAEALKLKDEVVMRVIDDVCQTLADTCISMRHALNPDKIIFGGGLIEACGHYMIPRIQKISDRSPFFKRIDNCKIVASYLGDDAVLLGGVYFIQQILGEKISSVDAYYPHVELKDKNVVIDKKNYKESIYVRADTKVRSIESEGDFNKFRKSNKIDVAAISKICKKHPEFVIIATNGSPVRVTKKAEKWLIGQTINYRIAPMAQAIDLYNTIKKRKVLVVKH